GHRQQFDMAESHVLDIGYELGCQRAIVEEAVVAITTPGTDVHLVAVERRMQPFGACACLQPGIVLPDVAVARRDAGRRAGTLLETEAVGVGLEQYLAAVPVADLIFVDFAGFQARNEDFPDAARTVCPHRMHTAIPAIEI